MKEVVMIDVVAARQWRIKTEEEILRQEKQSRDFCLHDSISWLKFADGLQSSSTLANVARRSLR